jgi:hypothetical protein
MENYHVPIKEKSLKFGEVLTPKLLVDEFLNKSCDYIDYSNPNLKILDTGAGLGAFSLSMLNILLKYHSKEHILNNMLYLIEIQEDNYNYLKDNYVNVICNDYLKYNYDFKFDIVMGNPPFNVPKLISGNKGSKQNLWSKFLLKSIDLIKNNGYLLYILPPTWRKPPAKKKEPYVEILCNLNNMLYLKCYSSKEGIKMFNASTAFDYFIVKKENKHINTKFIGYDKIEINVDFKNKIWIPNYMVNEIYDMISNPLCNILHSRSDYGSDKKHISRIKTDIHKYPIIHATNMNEIVILWSSENKGHFGIPKVIFSDSGKGYKNAFNDFKGEYGISQVTTGIIIDSFEEGELIIKAMQTKIFEDIMKACLFTQGYIDWRVYAYFNKDFYNIILSY